MRGARQYVGLVGLILTLALLVAACGGATVTATTPATIAVAQTTQTVATPTQIPKPTPTEAPTPSIAIIPTAPPATAAEQAYADYLSGQIRVLTATIGIVADDVQQPLTSLDVLSDPGWQATIRADVAIWHQAHLDAEAKTPPDSLQAASAPFLTGLGNLDQCGRDVTMVLADNAQNGVADLGLLTTCKNLLQRAQSDLASAQTGLVAWQSDHAAQP